MDAFEPMEEAPLLCPATLNVRLRMQLSEAPRRLVGTPSGAEPLWRWAQLHSSTRTEHASKALLMVAGHVSSTVNQFYGELITTSPRGDMQRGIVNTTRLGDGTVWRVLHWPQGLRKVHQWFDEHVANTFDYIIQNQDGGRGELLVHHPDKLAVLLRFAAKLYELVESVRLGAFRGGARAGPVHLTQQAQLAEPVLRAIEGFRARCQAQLARLAVHRELLQSTALKMPVLALLLCNAELARRYALPHEVVELIVNRAYPAPPRRTPAWVRQLGRCKQSARSPLTVVSPRCAPRDGTSTSTEAHGLPGLGGPSQ
jgi:hypothetical protein